MNRKSKEFCIGISIFSAILALRMFKEVLEYYNATLFALSYKYGFISRGLMGTVYSGLAKILRADWMNYQSVYNFNVVFTIIYLIVLIIFVMTLQTKIKDENLKTYRYLSVLFLIYAAPMFVSTQNFGRLDLYLYILSFVAMMLIVCKKCEWLVVPISIVCVCIHQGFVFTNANLILALLFYGIFMAKDKKELKKYIVLFTVTLISVSVLFLYFEFGSHNSGQKIYEAVVEDAKALSESGEDYNGAIIKHEILGQDVYEDETEHRQNNRQEFPVYLLMYSPYIIMGLLYFKRLLREKGAKKKLAYLGIFFAAATILPEMILKVDYGRYMFTISTYYIAIIMAMMAWGDEVAIASLETTRTNLKKRFALPIVFLIYPMFLMPFGDVIISGAVHSLSELIVNHSF